MSKKKRQTVREAAVQARNASVKKSKSPRPKAPPLADLMKLAKQFSPPPEYFEGEMKRPW